MVNIKTIQHDVGAADRDELGDAFVDAFYEEDNASHDIGKGIINTLLECTTQAEIDIADHMLIATCGYSIESLMERM